jgi:hypothetical protein
VLHPYALGAIKPVRGTIGPNAERHTRDLLTLRMRPVVLQLRVEECGSVENWEYTPKGDTFMFVL